MAWKIFDSDVPPLKSSRPDRASIEKSCFKHPADPEVLFDNGFGQALPVRRFGEQFRALD